MPSFRIEVRTYDDSEDSQLWYPNGLRFRYRADARAYGSDLFARWLSARQWRCVVDERPPNYWYDRWERRLRPLGTDPRTTTPIDDHPLYSGKLDEPQSSATMPADES